MFTCRLTRKQDDDRPKGVLPSVFGKRGCSVRFGDLPLHGPKVLKERLPRSASCKTVPSMTKLSKRDRELSRRTHAG